MTSHHNDKTHASSFKDKPPIPAGTVHSIGSPFGVLSISNQEILHSLVYSMKVGAEVLMEDLLAKTCGSVHDDKIRTAIRSIKEDYRDSKTHNNFRWTKSRQDGQAALESDYGRTDGDTLQEKYQDAIDAAEACGDEKFDLFR